MTSKNGKYCDGYVAFIMIALISYPGSAADVLTAFSHHIDP